MIVFASSTLDLTTDPVRLSWAVVVALTWVIASGSVLLRHRARTRRAEAIAAHVAEDPIEPAPLLVVFASQTGNAPAKFSSRMPMKRSKDPKIAR